MPSRPDPLPRLVPAPVRVAAPAHEPAPGTAALARGPSPRGPSPLALYASLLDATTLAAGAHRLATTLAAGHGFDRVSVGLREAGRTRLLASSHLDVGHTEGEIAERLVAAMDEALDQATTLAFPELDDAAEAAGATGVVPRLGPVLLAHRALGQLVGGFAASVPLGDAGEAFAAVCVERHGGAAFTVGELEHLEQMLMLAAPALRWMQLGTQPWHRRAWRETLQRLDALRRPERRLARRLWIGAAAAFAFVALVPLTDDVSGRARVEGSEQRVLAAPSDGFVKTAHVRPGDRVKAGAALVDLLDADLQLDGSRLASQLAQNENAYAAAMAKADRVAASTSVAKIGEIQAQLALVQEQLTRGHIVAPFDALVVSGDLIQSVGAPVRQGDTLLTLASTDRYRVVVEVDETDIARVQAGDAGRLALSSLAWGGQPLVVERVAPLAKAVEGRNVFEVEARLTEAGIDLRPGLIGRASLDAGRRPLLWAWGRHALDRLRMAWWAWLG